MNDAIAALLKDAATDIETADTRFGEFAEAIDALGDKVYAAWKGMAEPAFPDTLEGDLARLEYREARAAVEAVEMAVREVLQKLTDRMGYNVAAGWNCTQLRSAILCVEKAIERNEEEE